MVTNLKKHEKADKTYYNFNLILSLGQLPFESTGWRYWPESRVVQPPKVQIRGLWIATFKGMKKEQAECVRGLVEKRLAKGEDTAQEQLGYALVQSIVESFVDEAHSIKALFPSLYVDLYRYCSGCDPEIFKGLPEGRQWPDEVLDYVAAQLANGGRTVEEHEEDVARGVLTRADNEYVVSKLEQETKNDTDNTN